MTDKPEGKHTRNVVRDTACPNCQRLFYKHAVRVHVPFCKGTAGGAPERQLVTSAPVSGAPSPTTAPFRAAPKSCDWFE